MKKKGLIVATIVMVLVLAGSLTTATFAWFSSTAAVTVSNVNISTAAAEGLQIAMDNGDSANPQFVSGTELVYSAEDDTWGGNVEDWGSTISLATTETASFQSMQHASTLATQAQVTSMAGQNPAVTVAEGDFITAATYNTVGSNVQAVTYTASIENTNYLHMPMTIRATSANVTQIFYNIVITPVMGNVNVNMYPGMAAASRIIVNKGQAAADGEQAELSLTPFSDATISGGAMIESGTANRYGTQHSVTARRTAWTHSAFLYDGLSDPKTAIGAYVAIPFDVLAWIEGTDSECVNATAGSGFTIAITIGYKISTATQIESSAVGVDKLITIA